jgi:hypothetical protein
MQKIIYVLVGLVVVGGVWYITTTDTPTEEASTSTDAERATETAPDTVEPETLSGFGSLKNILGLGDTIRCEFRSTFEGQTSEGVFYTDGERFRVDSTVTSPESGTITSNMINDGIYTYTWGQSPQGAMAIKMATPEESDPMDWATEDWEANEESYVDFEQEVEYDCDRWNVDTSVFVPPSDVEFVDMEAMMQEAMQGMPEGFELPAGFPAY